MTTGTRPRRPVSTITTIPPFLPVALLAWFGMLAAFRLVDADEGWELMAARLITGGARPYFDFFTQQMPLLPWLLSGWGRVAGDGWAAGRTLAALIAAGSGWLVFRIAARATGSRRWGVAAAMLFALHALVFLWLPVVKTYGLTLLLLLGAWDCLAAGPNSRWRWALAGVLSGLAVETRLFVIAALPTLLYAGRRRIRPATTGWFLAGLLFALLPAIRDWAADPARLFYMNLGYHLGRADLPAAAMLARKAQVFLSLLGIGPERSVAGVQTAVLIAAAAALGWRVRRRFLPAPVPMALALAGLSLLPTPSFTQYFCLPVPFLILGLVEWAAAPGRRIARSGWIALAALYLIPVPFEWHRGAVSGTDLLVDDAPADWTPSAVARVAAAVDRELGERPEQVLAWWPGYLVGTRAIAVPGLENQFALSAALRTDESRHAAWRLVHPRTVAAMIRAGRPRLCVVGGWMVEVPAPVVRRLLAAQGWRIAERIGGTELWRRGPFAGALIY